MKSDLLHDAKVYREKKTEEEDKKSILDFAKLMGAGDKGQHLFDVGHYKTIKNSSRKTG